MGVAGAEGEGFFALGKPYGVTGPQDSRELFEIPDVVERYIERLSVENKPGPEFITQVGLMDGLALTEAVIGFFLRPSPSDSPPTAGSSSSTSA